MFGVASGCMVTYSARVALPICAVKISEELDLTKEEQGVVLGCFFWGYVMTQVRIIDNFLLYYQAQGATV